MIVILHVILAVILTAPYQAKVSNSIVPAGEGATLHPQTKTNSQDKFR